MTVQDYISSQPKSLALLFSVLRNKVMESGPRMQEKISYGIPFFYSQGPLCYLSPKDGGVYIGFVKGHQLANEQGLLETKNRKQIRSIRFATIADVSKLADALRQILNEAVLLNEYYSQQKKKK